MDGSAPAGPHNHQNRRHLASQAARSAITRTEAEVAEILETLRTNTGCKIELEHGLRRLLLYPLDWEMVQQRGCEVFLGRLPKDLMEDELFQLCSPLGKVLEIRLMLQPESVVANRGFAFVVFSRKEEARLAIEKLDRTEIRPGQRIGVKRSVDNCRLFMGGLPRDKTREDFEAEIRRHPACAAAMRKVIMYPAVQDRTKNRGFAFVEFASHREAAIARRQLMREKVQLWGKEICVDWAQPEGEVEQDVMNQVRILYVRNLNTETTEDTLRNLFSAALPEGQLIEKVKKLKDFGFIHFLDRADAQRALDTLNGHVVDGSQIEIMWAKPASAKLRVLHLQQDPQRRHHQDALWNRNQAFHFSPQTGLSQYVNPEYQMQFNHNQWQYMNGIRNVIPQRHFRNAAGTRTRFSRPNTFQTQDIYEGQMGTNLYPENFHYGAPDQMTPFHPTTYYNPAVIYQQHSHSSRMPYHPSSSVQYGPQQHLPYPNHNLHEQLSHMTLQGPVDGTMDNGSMPHSGPENGFSFNPNQLGSDQQ